MTLSSGYSFFDRLLHRLAFSGIGLQRSLADMEDTALARDTANIRLGAPVFVTSLPRAGTTLLLETLAQDPGFFTHTYRDMPFLLCPTIWHRLSSPLRRPATLAERAHGDGMLVGFDSPEAFEEIIWRTFWPSKFKDDRLVPFDADDRDQEFEAFYHRHMQKLAAIRASDTTIGMPPRYLAKNNALISRLPLLSTIFPDATIVLPVRPPREHVSSLLRQHARFVDEHDKDAFSKRYMGWLGHYEFGANLRPIDFTAWLDDPQAGRPDQPTFWLRYWVAAYQTVLSQTVPNLLIVDYEALCRDPRRLLEALAQRLQLADPTGFLALAERFRAPTRYEDADRRLPADLLAEADHLYDQLRRKALSDLV
ncbi:hypothetical protein CCR80_03940 [Rhodothalassium salexigens]|uniref:sulfotransferase n=1 Tax=Rhodothalassium salexigens TaxID=1086 RepID=UPI001911E898|nr:sulfotransferase [Rhodothalassium salexigens]MBK5920190.1 hypothetical protein [Rhodothalassium salexigens]